MSYKGRVLRLTLWLWHRASSRRSWMDGTADLLGEWHNRDIPVTPADIRSWG
jgi:hypothetical protein